MPAAWRCLHVQAIKCGLVADVAPDVLSQKSLVLLRFSALMMSVLPLLDLFSKDEAAEEMDNTNQL